MNDWEKQRILNLVEDFLTSNDQVLFDHIQAENGKKYLVLFAAEGTLSYNQHIQPMLSNISKPQPPDH